MLKRVVKTGTVFFVILLVVFGITVLFLSKQAETETGTNPATVRFTVARGESLLTLGERLRAAGLVSGKWPFVLYVLKSGKHRSLQAGDYSLKGSETIPELVDRIASGKVIPPGVRITFPEGWTIDDIAGRLSANNLPGEDFKKIVNAPFPKWREHYAFLAGLPAGQSLEGYLFPDTYIFPEQATGELIVNELLKNFGEKITSDMLTQAKAKGLTLHQWVTLASIVEAEVRTKEERRQVADLFLRRLEIGQALQSDATLRFILKDKKFKYSVEETQTASPYNTYQNPGLPPGPIGNPGLEALQSVIDPMPNEYFYFLNNPETGVTVFAKTFEEHVRNKAQNGL
ncbi:MAG: endolytic transglycosylase MltG [Candidatus Moraniibacteriota bacterium]